jgi:hypothetical protein
MDVIMVLKTIPCNLWKFTYETKDVDEGISGEVKVGIGSA